MKPLLSAAMNDAKNTSREKRNQRFAQMRRDDARFSGRVRFVFGFLFGSFIGVSLLWERILGIGRILRDNVPLYVVVILALGIAIGILYRKFGPQHFWSD
jgi:ABC-type transport system involved in cytochrome bd biosynthesis fused ATPase/permease subunit